jgi:hypothetical protein
MYPLYAVNFFDRRFSPQKPQGVVADVLLEVLMKVPFLDGGKVLARSGVLRTRPWHLREDFWYFAVHRRPQGFRSLKWFYRVFTSIN